MLLRKTLQQFTRKIIPFNVPFIKNASDTLHYLDKIRQNQILNRGIAPETQCLTIINSIHNNQWQIDQTNLVQRAPAAAQETWVNLVNFKKWVLIKYPPRVIRYTLIGLMYDIHYEKNEEPGEVQSRLDDIIAEIEQTMAVCNAYNVAHKQKPMPLLTNQEKWDAYMIVFYRNNTQDGEINRRVCKAIEKAKHVDSFQTMEKFISEEIYDIIHPKAEMWKRTQNLNSDSNSNRYAGKKRGNRDWDDDAAGRKRSKPSEPCRYGSKCNRSNCIFNHSSKPNTRPNPKSGKKWVTPCKYGAKCDRDDCRYFHSGGNNNQRKGRGGGKPNGPKGGKQYAGTCYRCGVKGHSATKCYSKFNIDQEAIKRGAPWKYKPKSDGSDDNFKKYTPNENPNHALHNEQQQRDGYVWYDERNGRRNKSNECK